MGEIASVLAIIPFLRHNFLVGCSGEMGVFGSRFARHTWSFVDLSFTLADEDVKAGELEVREEH